MRLIILLLLALIPANIGLCTSNQDYIPVAFIPLQSTILSSEVSGRIVDLKKEFGQRFNRGDLLLTIDKTYYINIQKKKSSLLREKSKRFEIISQLYNDHSVSELEFIEAKQEMETAEIDLKIANNNLENCSITAPFDGVIAQLSVQQHELVANETPLLAIIDDSILYGRVLIPGKLIDEFSIGKKFQIDIKEISQVVQATVSHIGAVLDTSSSTVEIRLKVPNKDRALKAGMTGLLHISQIADVQSK